MARILSDEVYQLVGRCACTGRHDVVLCYNAFISWCCERFGENTVAAYPPEKKALWRDETDIFFWSNNDLRKGIATPHRRLPKRLFHTVAADRQKEEKLTLQPDCICNTIH